MESNELSKDAELHLVRCVQAGNHDAFWELVRYYEPMLRNIVRQIKGDCKEVAGIVESHFYELVIEHDQGRIGNFKWDLLEKVRQEVNFHEAVATIPPRAHRRYRSIMATASGSMVAAAEICSRKGMSLSTFLQIHLLNNAIRASDISTEDLEPVEEEDSQFLAGIALASLEPVERLVTIEKWMKSNEVESDSVVAYLLAVDELGEEAAKQGQRILSSRGVCRIRHTAMNKMRDALAIS